MRSRTTIVRTLALVALAGSQSRRIAFTRVRQVYLVVVTVAIGVGGMALSADRSSLGAQAAELVEQIQRHALEVHGMALTRDDAFVPASRAQ